MPTLNRHNIEKRGGLAKVLGNLRRGQIAMAHLAYSDERLKTISASGVRSIFLFRDPRDVLVSDVHFLMRRPESPWHGPLLALPGMRDRVLLRLLGDAEKDLTPLATRFEEYEGWIESADLTVRFEDLVGAAGGGQTSAQLDTLAAIYRLAGANIADNSVGDLAGKVFSGSSPTFRRGTTGQWREHFDGDIVRLFKEVAGHVLIRYGYEADNNWQ